MSFRKTDVITFEDDEKVLVLEVLLHEGTEYLYVNEILPDESDITDVYRILKANYSDGTLEEVLDKEILEVILPMFQAKIEQSNIA